MIKNKTVLEVKIGERSYELNVSPDSPLGELFDAITQMQSFVVSKINDQSVKKTEEEELKQE